MDSPIIAASAWSDRFGTSLEVLAAVVISMAAMYASVLVLTRLAGLRSFAEMSAFDFVLTVAVGTIVGTTAISGTVSVPEGVVALVTIFAMKMAIAYGRVHGPSLFSVVDNDPKLVVRKGEILSEALKASRLTETDLRAKLREANVRHMDEVLAVVVETTGDVSVIHTSGEEDPDLDETLLEGVRTGPEERT